MAILISLSKTVCKRKDFEVACSQIIGDGQNTSEVLRMMVRCEAGRS